MKIRSSVSPATNIRNYIFDRQVRRIKFHEHRWMETVPHRSNYSPSTERWSAIFPPFSINSRRGSYRSNSRNSTPVRWHSVAQDTLRSADYYFAIYATGPDEIHLRHLFNLSAFIPGRRFVIFDAGEYKWILFVRRINFTRSPLQKNRSFPCLRC